MSDRSGYGHAHAPQLSGVKAPCVDCQTLVEVSRDALDKFRQVNRHLRACGEVPISQTEMARCSNCRELGDRRREEEQSKIYRRAQLLFKALSAGESIDASAQAWLVRNGYEDALRRIARRASSPKGRRA